MLIQKMEQMTHIMQPQIILAKYVHTTARKCQFPSVTGRSMILDGLCPGAGIKLFVAHICAYLAFNIILQFSQINPAQSLVCHNTTKHDQFINFSHCAIVPIGLSGI